MVDGGRPESVASAKRETDRINWLVRSKLRKLATASGGWDTLYLDPKDGRYWERTYPHGQLHGGGPPALTNISQETARDKYDV